MNEHRLDTLIIARAFTLQKRVSTGELLAPLERFCPSQVTAAAWRERLEVRASALIGSGVLRGDNSLEDKEELLRRIGKHHITKWQQLSDRLLPALPLGISSDDVKALSKLSSADAWAAAIVGRAQGTWRDGAPPSASSLCDSFAWQRLGLGGRAKRLPPEVRSLFLQQELSVGPARPERLLRQLAARELGVPRADARSLREGLVRVWLDGRTIAARASSPAFANDVLAVAQKAREGVFGDRKVFISEIWRQLRRDPAWAAVPLEDFKGRLLAAHRAGELVLARADLVAAMNPELVAASETIANGASFHFVVREMP